MEIIPEYSLSHYIEKGNKVYMDTLSLADDMQGVSAVSSANIVSLSNLWGPPPKCGAIQANTTGSCY